jgi:hypothetical protein
MSQSPGQEVSQGEVSHDRGTVDEEHHGWAPDAPGTGEAKEAAIQGHKKAFEANDTQEGSKGGAQQGPDLTPEGTGQSTTRRGEEVSRQEGKDAGRTDTGTQGESERPTGTSSARDSTGVNPQEPITGSPNMPAGDQGG